MAVRKRQTQPDPEPPKRKKSASIRRAVSDRDVAISQAILRLKKADEPRYVLAGRAGKTADHALRMFSDPPRQAWTVNELDDYARALGVHIVDVLTAAGLQPPSQTLTERILVDPELSASDAGILVSLLAIMRRARAADAQN